jgi:hypothetical protein
MLRNINPWSIVHPIDSLKIIFMQIGEERKIIRIDQQINELMVMKWKMREIMDAPSCEDCPIGQVLHSMSC